MNQEMEFKNIVAQYSKVKPEEMTGEMRFREDLGFTSLDFMSFLGELEDTFDIELEETEVTQITTLEEALKLLEELQKERRCCPQKSEGGEKHADQGYIRRKCTEIWRSQSSKMA